MLGLLAHYISHVVLESDCDQQMNQLPSASFKRAKLPTKVNVTDEQNGDYLDHTEFRSTDPKV